MSKPTWTFSWKHHCPLAIPTMCSYSPSPCQCFTCFKPNILIITTTYPGNYAPHTTLHYSIHLIHLFPQLKSHRNNSTQKNIKYQMLVDTLENVGWRVTMAIIMANIRGKILTNIVTKTFEQYYIGLVPTQACNQYINLLTIKDLYHTHAQQN